MYVYYDVTTRKTILFYIHRLGSEHHSFTVSIYFSALQFSPFAVQLPTVTCSVIFWTKTLHKERLTIWAKEDEAGQNLATVDTGYLHNVTRYVHSYKANVEILQRTLHLVQAEHEWFAQNLGAPSGYTTSSGSFMTIHGSLAAQCFQSKTIYTWSEEVVKRTQILIDLVCTPSLKRELFSS